MKPLKAHPSLLLLLIGMCLLSAGMLPYSDPFFTSLTQSLQQYNTKLPQEKVYLQLDKPFYKPGDAIWFQTYLVDGVRHTPSATSNVVYVELINPKGAIEKKLTLAVEEGRASGNFELEQAAPGGMYKLRAYTLWMQNFSEESFFSKDVQVQKVIKPRLLLKLDFERDAYGPGETVVATLKARDLEDAPIANQEINYTVQLAGKMAILRKARLTAGGEAVINFALPDTLSANDGLLNILVPHKGITESVSRSIPIVLNTIALEFFPEGGDLVQGMHSRVAFKALNEWGKPADVEGEIIDDKGQKLASFKSFHKGMGAFSFTPQKDQQYSARITKPVALAKGYALPKPLANGYGLSIEKNGASWLRLSIYSPLAKPVYVVGQVRGEIYYTKEINVKAGYTHMEVPLEEFPIGVAQFTLFDHQQLERCERLVFVNQQRKLYVDITTDKKSYQPREKVAVNVRTYDEHQLPVPATLSLSVVDDKLISFADDKQDNILSQLLLSSDVRGKIEEPSYYFDPEEEKATEALDYLLMTQAWRRFTWQEVKSKQTSIRFYPEKLGNISGRVINSHNQKPVDATITLVEVSNRRRAAQLKTKPDGSFIFMNVDPAAAVQLFAKGSGVKQENLQLLLDSEVLPYYNQLAEVGSFLENEKYELLESSAMPDIIEVPDEEEIEDIGLFDMEANGRAFSSQAIVLQEDVEQLQEVVVVGYGIEGQSNLSGSMTSIRAEDIAGLPNQTLEQALQGRVAGVQITQNSGIPGAAGRIMIRGTNSIGNNNPLFVIDGFPVDMGSGDRSSVLELLSPEDIRSVSVIKSAEATALYGSRASNGVVLINTKSGRYYHPNFNVRREDNYASLYIEPRKFSAVREFYSPDYAGEQQPGERTDFRETIYWNPLIKTDRTGEANISFYNSDATTAFRLTVEGIGANGYVGRQEFVYSTSLPLSVEAKIPAYLSFEDRVLIPITITNKTDKPLAGELEILAPPVLKLLSEWNPAVEIAPNTSTTYYYEALVQNQAGAFEMACILKAGNFQDRLVQQIEILPKGFPISISFSGKALDNAFTFPITDPVPGSINAGFSAYPDVVGDLMGGIASILRQPHGCFEQVSSSTYPNVLALQFLRQIRRSNPDVEAKALKYIKDGYQQLAAYETSEHGFEWYGDTPPHEGLTAFGLLELTEMKKVYDGVSEPLLNRTREWLLKRRKGDGNFKQNKGLYGFSAASREVNNAYIVYALASCGVDNAIEKEYKLAIQEAEQSKDAYRTALMANAAFLLHKNDAAASLMKGLRRQIKEAGWGKLKADHSLVRSYGNSLQIETASLIILAMLKESQPNLAELQAATSYLLSQRNHGEFGSTQGTVMALTALTEWAKFSNRTQEGGLISLYLNGKSVASTRYDKEHRGEILLASLEKEMAAGNQQLKISFSDTREALPYSFNASWTSYTPASSKDCQVTLSTKLSAAEVKVQETIRLTTTLTNRSASGIPQTVAVVGIPSGLSVQPWQLKELQEKGLFDFYEVQGNYLIFYFREMGPKEKRTIQLDLKAEVPGTYQAAASSAYLYYTNEHKTWETGTKVTVMK